MPQLDVAKRRRRAPDKCTYQASKKAPEKCKRRNKTHQISAEYGGEKHQRSAQAAQLLFWSNPEAAPGLQLSGFYINLGMYEHPEQRFSNA